MKGVIYMSHTYSQYNYNTKTLRIIQADPKNIKLVNFVKETGNPKQLRNTSYFGVNGSWFNSGGNNNILNIAYQSGKCMGTSGTDGKKNTVGSGLTLWTGSALRHYDDVLSINDIDLPTVQNSWAQGGIALHLGNKNWKSLVEDQPNGGYYLDGNDRRTAMVADLTSKKIYLIMTNLDSSFSEFRDALCDYLNISDRSSSDNSRYKGLMLDGGASSQLRAKTSDNVIVNMPAIGVITRAVAQAITVS